MITVALKMIRSNISRFILTAIGFVVAVMVLLMGLYYQTLSNTVLGKLGSEYSLETQSDYMELLDPLQKQTEFTWAFIIVGVVLSLLVLIMVINSICINIYQQKRFSNLLSLLGYSRQRTCRLFAYQSLIYGFVGSLIGALSAYLVTTFIGMRMHSALGDYGFSSSELMLPLHYVFLVMCMFSLLSFSLGYIAAEIKVRR